MLIREINKLRGGVVIPEFTGRVVKVYPPKDPTEGQRRAGLHKQNLEVQSSNGETLRVTLIKPNLHMPQEEAGKLFHFKSTTDDKGKLGGIITCEWHDDQKDEDLFYVELNGQAHFYAIDEGKVDKPAPERVGNNRAAKQAAAGEFTPSVADHANFYGSIVEALEERLANSKLMDAFLRDPQPLMGAATSIFIQCNQNGTFRRFVGNPVSSNAGVASQYENPQPEKESFDGRYNESMLANDLHTQGMEPDEDILDKHQLDPEKVYDELVFLWRKDGEEQQIIDACYDRLKNIMSRNGKITVSAADVCREILRDYPNFVAMFPQAHAARDQQQAGKQSARPAEDDAFNPADVFTDEILTP